eukprot:m.34643 g.34643  ORF g.34643 m.34643 type:complete len:301 (+) comp12686_c0_seq1:326-1228(+)
MTAACRPGWRPMTRPAPTAALARTTGCGLAARAARPGQSAASSSASSTHRSCFDGIKWRQCRLTALAGSTRLGSTSARPRRARRARHQAHQAHLLRPERRLTAAGVRPRGSWRGSKFCPSGQTLASLSARRLDRKLQVYRCWSTGSTICGRVGAVISNAEASTAPSCPTATGLIVTRLQHRHTASSPTSSARTPAPPTRPTTAATLRARTAGPRISATGLVRSRVTRESATPTPPRRLEKIFAQCTLPSASRPCGSGHEHNANRRRARFPSASTAFPLYIILIFIQMRKVKATDSTHRCA